MAVLRTVAAAAAAVALVGSVQATENPLPPCLDPFQPFVYSGCFRDTGSPQILPYRSPSPSDDMTVDKCVAECKGNGYRYAGLVYHGVCYCGQTVNGPQVEESLCNMPCNGNSSQICGSDNIFSIYQDPTFQPIEDVTIEDYDPLGCWTDDSSSGRALVYRQDQLDSATLTTAKCLQACRDGGFPFAGTEFGGECYCGVVIGNDTYAADASQCDMPCNGASSEKCGGRGRLNLFVADELKSLQPCGYEPPVSSSTTLPPSSTTTSSSASSTSSTTTTASSSASSTTCTETSTTATTSDVVTSTTATPTDSKTSSTTTTSSAVCVTTTAVPPTCEWKCGKWCSSPLPDWDDVKSCKAAWSNCALQVASCFKHAGWPDVLECFDFGEWCSDVSTYCHSNPRGGCKKTDFWAKKPPRGPHNPPKTTVITTTCPPQTTAAPTTTSKPGHGQPTTTTTSKTKTTSSSTTKCPIPTPTNICIQPSNPHYGYGPGKPVGGIEMPVVTCNDLAEDWPNYPFKGYTETESKQCKRYRRNQCPNACADACKEQYEDCLDVYAEGCKSKGKGGNNGWGGSWGWGHKARGLDRDSSDAAAKKSFFEFARSVEKRTFRWHDDFDGAKNKCKVQYQDCLRVNRGVTGAGKCKDFDKW